ncbi:ATP phosphoribosyltransferase [Aeromicrobium chenweiae]|uniref:ATP phosphoribosyltransferase n=1 Tax=Aeromicrobium chenweiae TaxID=2079793 RepID=A0A2S0WMH0_9ACTN|nr:ATP phosphoribosyltransferase [Aeromicrobium chenweiae]AWB92525.1 ATP phosphoribosyltransferase [Aeromicrobium chenweiae]TGN33511.1 ATP phosphoribosyltransferase [Aeromicrobium chenweiae]
MLKIAVPNKGALAEAAAQMLLEAGYRQRRNAKDLVSIDPDNGVEFFYLRPRDIAIYVGEGTLDAGITGRDLLMDSQAHATENISLGFGASTFRFAAPIGTMTSIDDLQGSRIATSYEGIVGAYLAERGISADVVRLDGAVESSVRLGVADAIADVVETGSTLRQADLEVFGDPILSSEGVLITQKDAPEPEGFAVFKRRIDSVLVARTYVMMDYDIRAEQVERAVELTPGIESPTVSPLHREGWVAVRSMVPRETSQRIMDSLYGLGARGILVTDILSCRI